MSSATTMATRSAQNTKVVAKAKRPKRRLPARTCAEPGTRMLRPTSHQARLVISAVAATPGCRTMLDELTRDTGSQLALQHRVLLENQRLESCRELLEPGGKRGVRGGENADRQQSRVAGAADRNRGDRDTGGHLHD